MLQEHELFPLDTDLTSQLINRVIENGLELLEFANNRLSAIKAPQTNPPQESSGDAEK